MFSFDLGWKFKRGMFSEDTDTSSWENVTLPHDFAISMPFADQSEFDFPGTVKGDWVGGLEQSNKLNGHFARGKGCYCKNFKLDVPKGFLAFLVFDGIYRNSSLYLNGKLIHKQSNGYAGFEVDITDFLKDENRLFIQVDNGRPSTSRWYTGSGIYRHVYIDLRPVCFPKDIKIETPVITDAYADIKVTGYLTKANSGKIEIVDADNNLVDTKEFTTDGAIDIAMKVNNPKLWDIESPNLYRLKLTVSGQEYVYRFGIRTIEFKVGEGMFLNGRRIFCNGFNIHHDLGVGGTAVFKSIIKDRLIKMQQLGVNALRLSHNPHDPIVLDLCDEMGILVYDECFDKLGDQYVDDFENTWKDELTWFIKRDWNHPSVFIWSVGNETSQQISGTVEGVEYIKTIVDFAKTVDTTRPVTCAQYPSRNGVAWNQPGYLENTVADKVCEVTDICACNYTWRFYEKDLKEHPEYLYIQSEAHIGREDLCGWKTVTSLPQVCGQFYWGGIDYFGESVSDTTHGWWRGFFDITMNLRPLGRQIEAMFKKTPVIHTCVGGSASDLLWNDVNLGWKFVFDHWNWKEDSDVEIIVYSNAKSVKLFLNGEDMGELKDGGFGNFITNIKYHPGELTSVGYDENGVELCRHTIKTHSEPAELRLTPICDSVVADGTDAVAIDVELYDKNNLLCQTVRENVKFEIENGEFAGIGSADLYTTIPFGTPDYPLYLGRAQAVVRGDNSGKDIVMTVSMGQLKKSVTIKVK